MVTRRGALTGIAGAGLAQAAAAQPQARRRPSGTRAIHDVAVIGAGVFGVWTA